MKAKTVLILLLVAGLLAATAMLTFKPVEDTGDLKMGARLLADLPVNQVAAVVIADGANRTSLVKGEKVWQVAERSGYPADFDALRDTVVKLSRLKIGRSFAGTADSLTRLSLLQPTDTNVSARGQQITLKDASGKILADLILGQPRSSDNGGGAGQYLRKADGDTVFLVDGSFRFLKTTPAEWLEKEILNIQADEVQTVACFTGDGSDPVYTLSRPQQGAPAVLTPLPAGRTADTAKIDQVLDALAPLSLDDVEPAEGSPPPSSGQVRLVYTLYDRREITIYPIAAGEDRYRLRVKARQMEALPEPEGNETSEAQDADKPEESSTGKEAVAWKTAQEINANVGPWVFAIKKWQFDSFFTQLASLLEEVEKTGG